MAMERENRAPRAGGPNRKRKKVCQFCVTSASISTIRTPPSCAASSPSVRRSCPAEPPVPARWHQRQLTEAIKRARQIALLPFVTE